MNGCVMQPAFTTACIFTTAVSLHMWEDELIGRGLSAFVIFLIKVENIFGTEPNVRY